VNWDSFSISWLLFEAPTAEIPDYFTRLAKLEAEVDAYQARSR
jgi:hypothetical protein